jgi:hypothetical protein
MQDLNETNRFPSDSENESAMVATESASFQKFDEWMDGELEILVARWIHTAAPNANRLERQRARFGK